MSLLDSLRAISHEQPHTKPQAEGKFTDCWQETKILDDEIYENMWDVDGETLSLMQNEPIGEDFSPEQVLFLDTETTGLNGGAGTVAFLVGLGWLTEDGFTVRQFVMRDYPEEKFLLEKVAAEAAQFRYLCTFNGKTFDIPLLRTRFTMNRMKCDALELPHIDLLQMARSLWKMRLKRCNLTSLEEKILGFPREHDLPGSEAPERYFSFLRTGQFDLLREVIDHNRQDVASLSVLLAKMTEMYRCPQQISFGEDLLSMGKSLEKRNHGSEAEICYTLAEKISTGTVNAETNLHLADSLKRQGRMEEAAEIWRAMIARNQAVPLPHVKLAMYYEHNLRDNKAALEITERAISAVSEPDIDSLNREKQREELMHRYRRLVRKVQNSE